MSEKRCVGKFYENLHNLACMDCGKYDECLEKSVKERKRLMKEGKITIQAKRGGKIE